MSEDLFIERLKRKDQSAFRDLVEKSGSKVYNTALGILQNPEDAEDISQEVFIEVYNSISQFRQDSKLSTWIYRITITKSLEFQKRKNRKKRFAFFQTLIGLEETIADKDKQFYHPGVQLENKEQAAILFQAINKLPENQKSAFILHKLEGLSYAEIGEVLNLSVSSVESLMFRAKQNLQKWLAGYYGSDEVMR